MNRLPLRVILAGFNIDRDILNELIDAAYDNGEPPPRESITPETISAAYARISRNPAEVPELRAAARIEVEKARRSNENIIFGLGHASVAEHVVFNIDVLGISRLAVEAVQHHRLASFTEKSQRYIRLDGDFVLPPEISGTPLERDFNDLIDFQNETYRTLYPKLKKHFIQVCAEQGGESTEGPAKSRAAEDARYVVSLATQAQFGMTVNARTLEGMARSCLAHPLVEVRSFGEKLTDTVRGLAPSLVKYISATPYEKSVAGRIQLWSNTGEKTEQEVKLVHVDSRGEELVLTSLLARCERVGFEEAAGRIEKMTHEKREELVRDTLCHCALWDPPPREFELAGFTFEIIISSTAFAQLKRHRMATQLWGAYDPSLGWTVPESVEAVGELDRFGEVMQRSAGLASRIAEINEAAAPYALTNAHRRRVIFHANAREMQHVSRLREDLHAQWDIRRLATKMVALAREAAPALMLMAAGKHDFEKRREEVFGTGTSRME